MSVSAGQPAPAELLIDPERLVAAYYEQRPDPAVPEQRVAVLGHPSLEHPVSGFSGGVGHTRRHTGRPSRTATWSKVSPSPGICSLGREAPLTGATRSRSPQARCGEVSVGLLRLAHSRPQRARASAREPRRGHQHVYARRFVSAAGNERLSGRAGCATGRENTGRRRGPPARATARCICPPSLPALPEPSRGGRPLTSEKGISDCRTSLRP